MNGQSGEVTGTSNGEEEDKLNLRLCVRGGRCANRSAHTQSDKYVCRVNKQILSDVTFNFACLSMFTSSCSKISH